MPAGWQKLIPSRDCFRGEGRYRIDAYSEFLPAPQVGWKPYGNRAPDPELFHADDPFGWYVSEFAEARELQNGLIQVGTQLLKKLGKVLDQLPDSEILRTDLADNHFWPAELADGPRLHHERCVTLLPLALSRTQDDKGRVRWTLFGNSEQGPGKAFWKSFYTAPKKEKPEDEAVPFFSRLLQTVYDEQAEGLEGLYKAGFRILPDREPLFDFWAETLPSWTESLVISERPAIESVKYLLTFRPFSRLPAPVKKAYLLGKLHLLPFPGSLVFWGVPGYRRLHLELPLALQIPLLPCIAWHRVPEGLRVPQSGYMHEPTKDRPEVHSHAGHIRNTFKRTHRWDKVLRDHDELELIKNEDKMLHVLFSTIPEDIDLYDKPMARNVQIWTEEHDLLLDGPTATHEQIKHAFHTVKEGGLFGYRFICPAMRIGLHEVYWHRPLVAYRTDEGEARVLPDAPLGYLTAYSADKPKLENAIELWPRIQRRSIPTAVLHLQPPGPGRSITPMVRSVNKLLDAYIKRGERPLTRSLARQLLMPHHNQNLESWLEALPGETLAAEVRALIEPEDAPMVPARGGAKVPDSLTYTRTATRRFEVNYWKTIAGLAESKFLNKNNADCIHCSITQKIIPYHTRQLDDLGDFLLGYYARKIAKAEMKGRAFAGEVPFQWQTDFDFDWMGGWLKNQKRPAERDILMMIPGKDRSRAVIMSDHYDTAYMADKYDINCGGIGARIAACGADDNHSATAAMMLAAPIFLQMSKRGQLACDIWLIHLTGEEFPADCLGARALTQKLIEGTLELHLPSGKKKDLSGVEVKGLYVSDMIAHNNDHCRDVFQISPGVDPAAFWLAEQAHIATEIWNASVPVWNTQPDRVGKERGRRSPHGGAIPEIAPYLHLSGEVRTFIDPRSTLYNTDGQIFSDAGVPCVLFMENYDINRQGYHDTHDTMENIDLDYGAAVCAITIESVARAATEGYEPK
jgi:hypothetical protein